MDVFLLGDTATNALQLTARRERATDLMTDGLRRLRCWCVRSIFSKYDGVRTRCSLCFCFLSKEYLMSLIWHVVWLAVEVLSAMKKNDDRG